MLVAFLYMNSEKATKKGIQFIVEKKKPRNKFKEANSSLLNTNERNGKKHSKDEKKITCS